MLQSLLAEYGYLAVLLGAFLEGETILVLGGLAAKLGYLELPWVMVCAFVGGFCGDQLYFFIGRYHGKALLARHPHWAQRSRWVNHLLERHQVLLILSFHFLYGVRTITPFAIGMSEVPTLRFMILNAFSVALWAVMVGLAGFLFGRTLEAFLGDLEDFELLALGAIIAISVLGWLYYNRRRRQLDRSRAPGLLAGPAPSPMGDPDTASEKNSSTKR